MLRRGDRIAQLVVQRFERARFVEVPELPDSVRGAGGYGSTGGFGPATDRRDDAGTPPEGRHVKFRRKAAEPDAAVEPLDDPAEPTDEAPDQGLGTGGVTGGPYDADDVDDTDGRVDLGALLVLPVEGTDLQLQVDDASGNVLSVLFAGPEGALELRVFAAPRNGDLWSEVRPQIAAETWAAGAAPPPSARAGSAPSWSARCRSSCPTATTVSSRRG